ncbi:MAG: type II secretion system protein GspK [Ectothiorhodospiraceae bacterium]|jgi:general secretion pathway protein K|nr:type II secretion system protein GspK [Ectothiorhodospiraceae bacterium]
MRRVAASIVRRRERGLALVLVLWVITLMMVMLAAFSYALRTETRLTMHARDSAESRAVAEAAVHYAAALLLSDPAGERVARDGTPLEWSFAEHVVTLTIQGENGLVSLNGASPQALEQVLIAAGVDVGEVPRLLDVIADWRDADDLVRSLGAEAADYPALGYPAGPKDGNFQAVQELLQVPGITPEIYRGLAPLVTVNTSMGGVDPRFVDARVLGALSGDAAGIEAFMQARQANPNFNPLTVLQLPFFQFTTPQSFRVVAEVAMQNGRRAYMASIQLRPGQEPPLQVMSWDENWVSDAFWGYLD